MAYATVAHVSALDRGRDPFTAGSKPNTIEVVRFLEQRAAEIDAILRTRDLILPVPPTATYALALLELYNAQGADCLVQQAATNSDRRKEACDAWLAAKEFLAMADLDIPSDPAQFGSPSGGVDRDPIFSFATGVLDRSPPWF